MYTLRAQLRTGMTGRNISLTVPETSPYSAIQFLSYLIFFQAMYSAARVYLRHVLERPWC